MHKKDNAPISSTNFNLFPDICDKSLSWFYFILLIFIPQAVWFNNFFLIAFAWDFFNNFKF